MNLHLPQTEEAKAEALTLMGVSTVTCQNTCETWLAQKSRATFSTNQRLNQNQLWLVQSISRAWLPLHAFASRCDWFIWVCSRTVIGRRGNYFYVKILCGLTSKYPNLPLVIQYFLWLQPQADRNFARVTLCFLVATFKKRPSSFLFFAGKI